MTIIKIKRGARKNMPTLQVGELGYANDTGELNIGTSVGNNVLTNVRPNILHNSNFQVGLGKLDTSSVSFPDGTKRYYYGNYYIGNIKGSNVIVTRSNNGRLLFNSNNATPEIEYRMKLPKIVNGSASNNSQYHGKLMTISFDYVNNTSTAITASVGSGNNLSQVSLQPMASGRLFGSFTYIDTAFTDNSFNYMCVKLFRATGILNASFELGNFKLEMGSYPSAYSNYTVEEDICVLNQCFRKESFVARASIIAVGKLDFVVPIDIIDELNYATSITLAQYSINSLLWVEHTGFSISTSFDSALRLLKIGATKPLHGLADAVMIGQITVDNRIY